MVAVTLASDVRASIAQLPADDQNAALTALALRYAEAIDRVEDEVARLRVLTRSQAQLQAMAISGFLAVDALDEIRRLTKFLELVKVLNDLGPKLQSALESMGMGKVKAPAPAAPAKSRTTTADGKSAKTGQDLVPAAAVGQAPASPSSLAEFRASRTRKQQSDQT